MTGDFAIENRFSASPSFEAFTSMEEAVAAWRTAFKAWAQAEQARLDKDIAEFNGLVRTAARDDGGMNPMTVERAALANEEEA